MLQGHGVVSLLILLAGAQQAHHSSGLSGHLQLLRTGTGATALLSCFGHDCSGRVDNGPVLRRLVRSS